MNPKSKRMSSAIALLLTLAMSQLYIGVSLAQGGQQLSGIVSIPSGKAITINGASAISGATVFSGASIETPAGVEGTVSLGPLGSLEIGQNAKLNLEFQDGSIKVMLLQGCITLYTKIGTAGRVDSPKGVLGTTDPKADGRIRVCEDGAAPPPVTAGTGLFGAGVLADIATLAGFGFIVASPFIFGNRNPSPSNP